MSLQLLESKLERQSGFQLAWTHLMKPRDEKEANSYSGSNYVARLFLCLSSCTHLIVLTIVSAAGAAALPSACWSADALEAESCVSLRTFASMPGVDVRD